MSSDFKIIISDTSCLILLSKKDELELLRKLTDEVFITEEIEREFGKEIPSWIKIKSPNNTHYQEILEFSIDKGEASAIALALEIENSILLIDDLKGRRVAEKLNISYSGTFGLFIKAKGLGVIPSVKELLEKVKRTNFRFNEKLFEEVLREAGE